MEKNQKRTMVLCGIFASALVVFVILALLAPHGEDFPRSKETSILSGNLDTGRDGIYCMASVEGGILVEKGSQSTRWEFEVPKD
ncbi:MAG: hypothetical protein K2N63_02655, partial [Lachnospiraceae bacterium]|nr:hypothetical protein [Lachnospiraceae bacterium]